MKTPLHAISWTLINSENTLEYGTVSGNLVAGNMVQECTDAFVLRFQNHTENRICNSYTHRVFVAAMCAFAACISVVASAQQDVNTELQNALVFHDHADYTHSVPVLQNILRQAPGSYAANLLLGEDLFKSGRFADAVHPLQMAYKLRPQDGVAEIYLAQTEAALNDYPAASAAMLKVLHQPNTPASFIEAWAGYCLDRVQTIGPNLRNTKAGEAVALRIEAAFRPEGSEVREKLLEESATEAPKQRGIWGELGTAQLELGQRSGAMESLQTAQQQEPHANATLQLEGLLAAVNGDWPASEERLTALAARSPTEFRNALGIWLHVLAPRQVNEPVGWACFSDPSHGCPATLAQPQRGAGMSPQQLYLEGRWEQLAALPRPKNHSGLQDLWRGVASAEIGQCMNAIPLLEDGLKVDEQAAGFWLDICYANEGNSALIHLRKDGDTVAVEQLEGDIQMHLHDDAAAAEAHYAKALKADPGNAHLLERSAEAELRLGNTDEAKRAALAALTVDPHNPFAIKTLATLAIDERDYSDALVRLRELAAIEPQDPWTRVELGVSYLQLGDAKRALPYLQQELSAGYPDKKGGLHAMLARCLRQLGREQEAKKAETEATNLANASLEDNGQGSSHAPQ